MCRCVPIAVEEMLLRGMFVARLAFTPIRVVRRILGESLCPRPDRRHVQRSATSLSSCGATSWKLDRRRHPQTVHVLSSLPTCGRCHGPLLSHRGDEGYGPGFRGSGQAV